MERHDHPALGWSWRALCTYDDSRRLHAAGFYKQNGPRNAAARSVYFYFLKERSSLLKYIYNWHFIIPL